MDKELTKAAQVIRQAEEQRIKDCSEEIAKILNKYGCQFEPEFWIRHNKIESLVRITTRETQRDPTLLSGGNNTPDGGD